MIYGSQSFKQMPTLEASSIKPEPKDNHAHIYSERFYASFQYTSIFTPPSHFSLCKPSPHPPVSRNTVKQGKTGKQRFPPGKARVACPKTLQIREERVQQPFSFPPSFHHPSLTLDCTTFSSRTASLYLLAASLYCFCLTRALPCMWRIGTVWSFSSFSIIHDSLWYDMVSPTCRQQGGGEHSLISATAVIILAKRKGKLEVFPRILANLDLLSNLDERLLRFCISLQHTHRSP